MQGIPAFRTRLRGAYGTSLVALTLVIVHAVAGAQAADPALDASEQRRMQERLDAQQRQLEARPDVRLPSTLATTALRLPANETPCFLIQAIALQGPDAAFFGWLLPALAGANGADAPQGRCLGAQSIAVLTQRAQDVLVARGFVTSRVLAEPQNLASGRLALTLVAGRIGAIRLQNPDDPRARLANALPMQAGDILNLRDIEQALENWKRVPTAEADIDIVPGSQPGQSDLVVRWQQTLPLRLSLAGDDSGSRGSGKYQGSATLSYDNPLTLNDLLYVSFNRDLGGGEAGDRGTRGGAFHYSVPLGYWLFSVNTSRSRYSQTVAGASQD